MAKTIKRAAVEGGETKAVAKPKPVDVKPYLEKIVKKGGVQGSLANEALAALK